MSENNNEAHKPTVQINQTYADAFADVILESDEGARFLVHSYHLKAARSAARIVPGGIC
jgi:hypothetical protein